MIRLALLALLTVAAGVAYPWAALAVAVVGAAVLAVFHRQRTLPRQRVWVEHVSLERRVALRRAREELRGIERGAGLPDL